LITDDQVATLLREAVLTAPLPRPVDLAEVERQGRARRTTSRALGGLGVAAVLVLLAISWGSFDLNHRPVNDVAGSGTLASGTLALAWLAVLSVGFVACAIATVAAWRLPIGASARRAAAAAWGTLAALVIAVLPIWFDSLIVVPTRLVPLSRVGLLLAIVAAFLAPTWLALGLRRRLLGRYRGGLPATIWLLTAWAAGTWVGTVTSASVYLRAGGGPPTPASWLSLTILVTTACACAWPLLKRAGHPRPLLGAVGATGVVAAGEVASRYWSPAFLPLPATYSHLPALLMLAGSVTAALLGARACVGGLTTSPWRTAGLLALTGLVATSAGNHAAAVLFGAVANPALRVNMTGYAVWAAVLAVATACCLYVLDRRLDLGRSARSDAAEPLPAD
jgi:hypothetical protein